MKNTAAGSRPLLPPALLTKSERLPTSPQLELRARMSLMKFYFGGRGKRKARERERIRGERAVFIFSSLSLRSLPRLLSPP